uniref:Esterase GDSL/SGNH-like Acyl-Esterase family found in Pmr5 and Cas1p n=1 Tax=Myoviridae sp. ctakU3 TaxID=2825135 RepID=A0A8S5P100_9CAUD|nr:MAG TPA: Esterase GDSL/SGNH-like Acyl-Esterase family found in Pmr5 and Cas1p [Myoviridae sp. ctakU3]
MPYKQIESTHDWGGVSHTYPNSHEGRLPPELKKVKPSFWRRLLARIKTLFFIGDSQ